MTLSKRWGWAAAASVLLGASLLHAGQAKSKKGPVAVPWQNVFSPMASTYILTVNPMNPTITSPGPGSGATTNMTVTITITSPTNNKMWYLYISAGGDLSSGGVTIPIGTVSWTATCPAPTSGSGNSTCTTGSHALTTSNVRTASGEERHGSPATFVTDVNYVFSFTDSWSYSAGSYSQTLTLTLADV